MGPIMQHVEFDDVVTNTLMEVLSVRDFAKRYLLTAQEEERLVTLFGGFATRAELLANARRAPLFR